MPLPAEAVLIVLSGAERSLGMPPHRLREHFALVLAYICLWVGKTARLQDSTTLLAASDFGIDHRFLWLRLTEKQRKHLGSRRVVRIPVAPPPSQGVPSAIPRAVALARRFLHSKEEALERISVP